MSFQHVKVPDAKAREVDATLTFSDHNKAIEIRPEKGDPVSIPYSEIDRCAYEYTKHHRVTGGSLATAPIGVGAVLMLVPLPGQVCSGVPTPPVHAPPYSGV